MNFCRCFPLPKHFCHSDFSGYCRGLAESPGWKRSLNRHTVGPSWLWRVFTYDIYNLISQFPVGSVIWGRFLCHLCHLPSSHLADGKACPALVDQKGRSPADLAREAVFWDCERSSQTGTWITWPNDRWATFNWHSSWSFTLSEVLDSAVCF